MADIRVYMCLHEFETGHSVTRYSCSLAPLIRSAALRLLAHSLRRDQVTEDLKIVGDGWPPQQSPSTDTQKCSFLHILISASRMGQTNHLRRKAIDGNT